MVELRSPLALNRDFRFKQRLYGGKENLWIKSEMLTYPQRKNMMMMYSQLVKSKVPTSKSDINHMDECLAICGLDTDDRLTIIADFHVRYLVYKPACLRGVSGQGRKVSTSHV